MELLLLVFGCVMAAIVGIGIAIGLVACAIGGILIGLGIISSSVLVGISTGRPAHAFRAFFWQCGLLLGIPAGAVLAWLGGMVVKLGGNQWAIILFGALGGALAGVIVAIMLDVIRHQFCHWASARIEQ